MGIPKAFMPALMLGCLSWPALAEESPRQLLDRMVEAAKTRSYQGVVVHGMPSGVEAMRLFHRGGDEGSYRERLVMLTGSARQIVRDADKVHRYHPASGQVVIGPRRGGTGVFKLDPDSLDRLTDHYRLSHGPDGRVAGRDAAAVDLAPRDGQRFHYRVWRDRATHLPLKTVIRSNEGQVLETFMLATVDLDQEPREAQLRLQVPEGVERLQREQPGDTADPPVLEGIALPSGFRLGARFQGPEGGEHLLYSDGLATLSVFIEDGPSEQADGETELAILERGALRACTVRRGGQRVILLGEIPSNAMNRIAESLRSGKTAEETSP